MLNNNFNRAYSNNIRNKLCYFRWQSLIRKRTTDKNRDVIVALTEYFDSMAKKISIMSDSKEIITLYISLNRNIDPKEVVDIEAMTTMQLPEDVAMSLEYQVNL